MLLYFFQISESTQECTEESTQDSIFKGFFRAPRLFHGKCLGQFSVFDRGEKTQEKLGIHGKNVPDWKHRLTCWNAVLLEREGMREKERERAFVVADLLLVLLSVAVVVCACVAHECACECVCVCVCGS